MTLQVRERELHQQIEEANQRAERERDEAQQQIQEVKKEAEVIRLDCYTHVHMICEHLSRSLTM